MNETRTAQDLRVLVLLGAAAAVAFALSFLTFPSTADPLTGANARALMAVLDAARWPALGSAVCAFLGARHLVISRR